MNLEQIKTLIPKYLYEGKLELTPETKLEEDLGYYGEDAELLIIEFSERFNVDISGFDFRNYFSMERNIENLIRSFSNIKKRQKSKSLTLGDLVIAAKTGKLI